VERPPHFAFQLFLPFTSHLHKKTCQYTHTHIPLLTNEIPLPNHSIQTAILERDSKKKGLGITEAFPFKINTLPTFGGIGEY